VLAVRQREPLPGVGGAAAAGLGMDERERQERFFSHLDASGRRKKK
jgi:hypothetical protein